MGWHDQLCYNVLLQVRQGHDLRIPTAHAVSPFPQAKVTAGSKTAARVRGMQKGPAAVALNAESCLAEMLIMGSGLVEDALVKSTQPL